LTIKREAERERETLQELDLMKYVDHMSKQKSDR